MRDALEPVEITVRGVHEHSDPVAELGTAEAVFIGSGLLQVADCPVPYGAARGDGGRGARRTAVHGRQCGNHTAAPTLRSGNDMPIVQPPSFEALGLVPFPINPHYPDLDPASTHAGEA
ncbi:Type 1 glutamine amidotransferase-like domain-containing protein [Streptomyces sp. x-80]|uniref:Type 1 glutamine amidotransferase-like domain-containing protein n=1 Tax=Streptomyces sp. x-80 TaxID=2789282 RepID=UPI0039809401